MFVAFTIGDIAWIVYQFTEFGGCFWNNIIMAGTSVVGILMYVFVVIRVRQDASLFTSSLVLAYFLYLQWSALSSDTNSECNRFASETSSGNSVLKVVLGLVFTFSSLLVVSFT